MKELLAQIKDYIKLNIDYARLTLTEKVTLLLSAIGILIVLSLIGGLGLLFLFLALASLLASALGVFWSYMIVFSFFALVFVLICALRKPLIINPIARYISKLIMK